MLEVLEELLADIAGLFPRGDNPRERVS